MLKVMVPGRSPATVHEDSVMSFRVISPTPGVNSLAPTLPPTPPDVHVMSALLSEGARRERRGGGAGQVGRDSDTVNR